QRGSLLSNSRIPSYSWSSNSGSFELFMGEFMLGVVRGRLVRTAFPAVQREVAHGLEVVALEPGGPDQHGAEEREKQADGKHSEQADAFHPVRDVLNHNGSRVSALRLSPVPLAPPRAI